MDALAPEPRPLDAICAAAREAAWLVEHGAHEWEKHKLLEEAGEEVVDAWAYVQHQPNSQSMPWLKEALLTQLAALHQAVQAAPLAEDLL